MMEDMPKIVAANLLRLRRDRKLTQEELAHFAEIDRCYLGAIEQRKYKLTIVTFGKLANALQVLPAALVELPNEHPLHAEIASKS